MFCKGRAALRGDAIEKNSSWGEIAEMVLFLPICYRDDAVSSTLAGT